MSRNNRRGKAKKQIVFDQEKKSEKESQLFKERLEQITAKGQSIIRDDINSEVNHLTKEELIINQQSRLQNTSDEQPLDEQQMLLKRVFDQTYDQSPQKTESSNSSSTLENDKKTTQLSDKMVEKVQNDQSYDKTLSEAKITATEKTISTQGLISSSTKPSNEPVNNSADTKKQNQNTDDNKTDGQNSDDQNKKTLKEFQLNLEAKSRLKSEKKTDFWRSQWLKWSRGVDLSSLNLRKQIIHHSPRIIFLTMGLSFVAFGLSLLWNYEWRFSSEEGKASRGEEQKDQKDKDQVDDKSNNQLDQEALGDKADKNLQIIENQADAPKKDNPNNSNKNEENVLGIYKDENANESYSIVVNVSGAVVESGVVYLKDGARVGEALEMAGGLSARADAVYVQQHINLAAKVKDEEKIYIPYKGDTWLTETQPSNLKSITSLPQSGASQTISEGSSTNTKISLNSSSADMLDTLPGIGAARAQSIIENRPYTSIEELLERKVVSQSIYAQIESLVEL